MDPHLLRLLELTPHALLLSAQKADCDAVRPAPGGPHSDISLHLDSIYHAPIDRIAASVSIGIGGMI